MDYSTASIWTKRCVPFVASQAAVSRCSAFGPRSHRNEGVRRAAGLLRAGAVL